MSLAENELKMAATFKHMFHQNNKHTCTSVQNSTLGVQQITKTVVYTSMIKLLYIFLGYMTRITLMYFQHITPLKSFETNATRELFFDTALIT